MSGKYVPPAMRNKKANVEESKVKLPTQDDFPALGSNNSKTKASFKPIRSFAVLATEWQERDEEEKIRKEAQEMIERRDAERRELENRSVFIYRQHDFEHTTNAYDNDNQPDSLEVDEWTRIEKKARRELTAEELYEKKMRIEEEEKQMAEDSVWNHGNDDEWDYRDRRAYS